MDLTAAGVVEANKDYAFEVVVPAGLEAGVFKGVHYDNVDTVYA